MYLSEKNLNWEDVIMKNMITILWNIQLLESNPFAIKLHS